MDGGGGRLLKTPRASTLPATPVARFRRSVTARSPENLTNPSRHSADYVCLFAQETMKGRGLTITKGVRGITVDGGETSLKATNPNSRCIDQLCL